MNNTRNNDDRRTFQRVEPSQLGRRGETVLDPDLMDRVATILASVRTEGSAAVRSIAESLGDIESDQPMIIGRDALDDACAALAPAKRELFERVAERIRAFAQAQRDSVTNVEFPVPGGVARQVVRPVDVAGCYAPGGRFPLPSSMLMTAVTAKVAGVSTIIAASPKPTIETLAAASIAGVDGLLAVGGAQAIGAMAYGIDGIERCDVIVGPGNSWVTAAKALVSQQVRIDMLAGPSELLVIADDSADPDLIAGDLLAQAEHDPEAIPMLVVFDDATGRRIEDAVRAQLVTLETRAIASQSLANGGWCVARSVEDAASLANAIAPEHLQLNLVEDEPIRLQLRHFGGLFSGAASGEVLGDYGAGPNHTLPTGGTARHSSGLSVFDFLRMQTELRIDRPDEASSLASDAVEMAEIEGLSGHRRAAEARVRVSV